MGAQSRRAARRPVVLLVALVALVMGLLPTTGFAAESDTGNEITVQLNWQNQYREAEAAFGGVDDYAAFHLGSEGAGAVTISWNTTTGQVATEGEVTVTARMVEEGFSLHAGALEEEGDVVIALPAPTFQGPGDEPGTGELDRGEFTYSLDGTMNTDPATLAALDAALASGGLVDYYVNVSTVRNPAGEVRGQLHKTLADGGLHAIVPLFELLEFHELGTGTNTGEAQTSFNLWFDADIAFAGETGKQRPQPEDFVLTRERDGVSEQLPILRVRGDNPDWQPYPKQDIRLHLDTHDVIEDGDIVTVTLLDGGAKKLVPVGRNATAADLSDSWRTRCTHVISVPAMTSEPCGTPPQPGLSGYTATAIDSAPNQEQTFSVIIEEPGLPAGEELWIDLVDVSHDGLVDYSESAWTAVVEGSEVVGTAAFWEYEEIERFQTVWEPFLVFTHAEDAPVAGELVLSGTGIDGSDAALHGGDTAYDTYVVRHDTGRADYTEIAVEFVPQPTITLEPADAVVLAETGASLTVTATYTDADGVPVDSAEIRFWAEQGERPNIVEADLEPGITDEYGQTTLTYTYDGRDVVPGAPLIDTLRAQLVDDADPDARFVDARTTVSWATGVATNEESGATFHDLNDAVAEAETSDTITALGAFTSVYGLPHGDRVQVRTADLMLQAGGDGASLLGALDVRASGVTVDGFAVDHAGAMGYAFRVEGAGITISDNVIDANGVDGFRVRDAWRAAAGRNAVISGNRIRDAAIAIDVDNRDQEPELIVDLIIEDNLFEDNEVGIHYNPDGGTTSIAGNEFKLTTGVGVELYVRDATDTEVLDLAAILAGNGYDPAAEILDRRIMPIDPTAQPYMVEIVNHVRGGADGQYTDIRYNRPVTCDDSPEAASQFRLDRGPGTQPDRVGVAIDCDHAPAMIRVRWSGNPNLPNYIEYVEHADPTHHIRRADFPDVSAISPDTIDHRGPWPTLPGEEPAPTVTLEPADALLLAEAGTEHTVTATATCASGNPEAVDVTFTVTRDGQVVGTETVTTDAQTGKASFTHDLDATVVAGQPIVDTIVAATDGASASVTVTWAAGVATNPRTGAAFHALDHAIGAAEAGDTISAAGAFASDRVSIDRSLALEGTNAALHGAFDVQADAAAVRGFVVQAEGLDSAVRVAGNGVTISGNQLRGATVGIVVAGSTATVQGNRLVDNEMSISLEALGATVTGNELELADWVGKVFVEDTTSSYDLEAILASNTFDPDGEVLGRQIVPATARPPVSVATSPSLVNRKAFDVSYRYDDGGGSGVERVVLFVKKPGATSFNRARVDIGAEVDGKFGFVARVGDGVYRFYTVAVDEAGNREAAPAVADTRTRVDTVAPAIRNPRVVPNPFVVGDGEPALFRMRVTERSQKTFLVKRNGVVVKRIQTRFTPRGLVTRKWFGKNDAGRLVPDGRYVVVMKARDRAGNVTVARVPLRIVR
jgi:hypothetical protein